MVGIGDSLKRTIDLITIEFAKKFSGKRVLEIGCGRGERIKLFADAGCNTYTIDITDLRNEDLLSGYSFLIGDGRNPPFKNEIFEAVVSFDVIEHIDNDISFLSENYRICKNGGMLVLGTPNRNRLSHKLRQILGKRILYPLKIGKVCLHLIEYDMAGLAELVNRAGFKVIKEEYVWFGLMGIIGFKKFPRFLNKWAQYLIIFAVK